MSTHAASPAPIVTVLCLTYNHAPYIRQCLDGFVMQRTTFPFEVLVHDDASTDGTAAIVREYELRHPGLFRVIYQTQNQYSKHDGLLYANVARHIRGQYVAYCEGDDYWTNPDKLQLQLDYMLAHPRCTLCYTNLDYLYQDRGHTVHDYVTCGRHHMSRGFLDHLVNLKTVMPCTWLIRSDFFRDLPHRDYIDYTFPLALDAWAKGDVCFVDVNTATYRVLDESLCHSNSLQRIYGIRRGRFDIQLEYMQRYRSLVPALVRWWVCTQSYISLYKVAAVMGRSDAIAECERWWVRHVSPPGWLFMLLRRTGVLRRMYLRRYARRGFDVCQYGR